MERSNGTDFGLLTSLSPLETWKEANESSTYTPIVLKETNSDKTNFMSIQSNKEINSGSQKFQTFLIVEKEVEVANSVDFMGAILDDVLGWSEQLFEIEGKLAKGMIGTRKMSRS